MAEKVPLDKTQEFAKGEPEVVISRSSSDFSLSFGCPDGVEHENIHSDATSSTQVALSTAADLKMPATPTYQQRFVEQLDEIRTKPYWQEGEIELKGPDLSWPPSLGSLKIKVKRGLKIIKSYRKHSK